MKKTISCAFITKGEPELADAIASVRTHVDEVVVVHTGPAAALSVPHGTDRFLHYTEHTDEHGLNHFAKARQRSFDLATGDAVMWLDSDDKLAGGQLLRPVVESTPNDRPALIKLPYEYIRNEQGVCTTLQSRERIVMPPQAFEWHRRVHETLDPLGAPINVTLETPPALRVIHCRKAPQDHARNIRLCRMCLAEDPQDSRARFFLGLALFDAGDYQGAERELATYAEDTSASTDERIMALVRLAWLTMERTDPHAALKYALAAHAAKPWDICCFAVARAYHGIANLAYGQDEADAWAQALWWAFAGLGTEPTAAPLWQSPLDREGVIHCTISKALARHGNIEGALESVGKALAVLPDDTEMQSDLLTYRAVIAAKQLAAGRANTQQVLQQAERGFKAGTLSRTKVEQVRHQVQAGPRPKDPGELSIVFACGEAIEPWNPDLMHQHGIGGSEQAVVYMAEHLAMRGHHVRVYTNCGPQPRIFSRVEYFPTPMLPAAGGCDVLVGWRDGSAMEMVRAEARLLWAHDTQLANCNEWRWHLADRVLCLSEWHRECLTIAHPDLPPEKLWRTRNGLDMSAFQHGAERDPARAIFSSSPSRGLGVLLDLWPEIRARAMILGAKDPSLHIFYGFDSWEAMAARAGDTRSMAMIADFRERMAKAADQGVVYRGRVAPRALAAEMMAAGAWLYPSWNEMAGDSQWCETSCISAMEAQAAGLRIVTLAAGALPETVQGAGVLVDDDPRTGPGREDFITASALALVPDAIASQRAFASDERRRGWYTRSFTREIAQKRFEWAPVAEAWEALMHEILANPR